MSALKDESPQAIEFYFAAQHEVLLAYLFGSHARDQAGPLSDVDVAILLDASVTEDAYFDYRLRLTSDLIELLQSNEVDVVILNQASPALAYRVLRHGRLLYCRHEDARIMFTMRTVNNYLDIKPSLIGTSKPFWNALVEENFSMDITPITARLSVIANNLQGNLPQACRKGELP